MLRTLTVRIQTSLTHYAHTRSQNRGVTMLEYVMLGLMVVVVGLVLWRVFGSKLQSAFEQLGNAISS